MVLVSRLIHVRSSLNSLENLLGQFFLGGLAEVALPVKVVVVDVVNHLVHLSKNSANIIRRSCHI